MHTNLGWGSLKIEMQTGGVGQEQLINGIEKLKCSGVVGGVQIVLIQVLGYI